MPAQPAHARSTAPNARCSFRSKRRPIDGACDEDPLLEALAIRRRRATRRAPPRRVTKPVESPTASVRARRATSQDDRRVNEQRRRQPAEMAVDVLDQAERVERHRPPRYTWDTLAAVLCAAHPEIEAHAAVRRLLQEPLRACAAYERRRSELLRALRPRRGGRGAALGSALLALVGVGYLATLAVGSSSSRRVPSSVGSPRSSRSRSVVSLPDAPVTSAVERARAPRGRPRR